MEFNELVTRNDLADFLGIPRRKLTHVLYVRRPDSMYHSFDIAKKDGSPRTISAPNKELKDIQRRLAKEISSYISAVRERDGIVAKLSHAFEKEKSILTNAICHRNKRFVINLDLKDFFDSFHFGRVMGYFEKNKYFCLPHEVAVAIAQLTCFQGKLPQGAPTSPILTNLISNTLDQHLLSVARSYRMDYSRYADDLTFSTNWSGFEDLQGDFLTELYEVISSSGFQVNFKKTRVQLRDSRQEVTGIVVNKQLGVRKEYVRDTRAMADRLYRTGEYQIKGETGTLDQLEGRFSFIDQIDHFNSNGEKKNAYVLNSRENQYRTFVFYRTFINKGKPLIITEGKTDGRYLKAALMKLHKDYPRLVKKRADNSFEYSFSFFRRTKKMNSLFGMSSDGADAITFLYGYFTGDSNKKNYVKLFSEKYNRQLGRKVVLWFDNELAEDKKKKPLKNFMTHYKLLAQKEKLQENLVISLEKTPEVYVLTNPLVEGMDECEVEMMFDENTRNVTIDGKKLCLHGDYDTKLYYGKEIFSKYVLDHYLEIDFEGFKPLLDAMDKLFFPEEDGEKQGDDEQEEIVEEKKMTNDAVDDEK